MAADADMTGMRVLLDPGSPTADFEMALEDVTDDAWRRGGTAELDDVLSAAMRYGLDDGQRLELIDRAAGLGLLEPDPSVKHELDGPVLSRERTAAMRTSQRVPDALQLYLDRLRSIPLLTAADEVRLARAVAAGVAAEESGSRRRAVVALIEQGRRAKAQFIESNLRLVVFTAKPYRGQGLEFLDLIQHGTTGLIRAVELFDPTLGFKFSGYATHWIRQGVARGLANEGRTIRLPVHVVERLNKIKRCERELERETGRVPDIAEIAERAELDPADVAFVVHAARGVRSLDAPLSVGEDLTLVETVVDPSPSVEDAIDEACVRETVRAALENLSYRERRVIELRYGLDGSAPVTLDGVGQRFNVTRERIRQIENEAKKKLVPVFWKQGLGRPHVEAD